jgi:hypothetical protein
MVCAADNAPAPRQVRDPRHGGLTAAVRGGYAQRVAHRGRVRARGWALPVVVAVVASAAPAGAEQPARVKLTYQRGEGADGCPDASAIVAGVGARLGYEPFEDAAAKRLDVSVQVAEHVLSARIEMIDADGRIMAERVLTSRRSDCTELAATMQLAIAIAIDPFHATATASPPASEQRPPPAPPAEASPRAMTSTTIISSPPPPHAPRPAPMTATVSAAAVGGVGTAPSSTLGALARVTLRRSALSLSLEGRVDRPTSDPQPVGSISTSLLVASVAPCGHVRLFSACGLVTGGVFRAAGHGLIDARNVVAPYFALGARIATELPIHSRLAFVANIDVVAPLTQTDLLVGGEQVWTTPSISALAALGLSFTFS